MKGPQALGTRITKTMTPSCKTQSSNLLLAPPPITGVTTQGVTEDRGQPLELRRTITGMMEYCHWNDRWKARWRTATGHGVICNSHWCDTSSPEADFDRVPPPLKDAHTKVTPTGIVNTLNDQTEAEVSRPGMIRASMRLATSALNGCYSMLTQNFGACADSVVPGSLLTSPTPPPPKRKRVWD